jgi:hypothetical protein
VKVDLKPGSVLAPPNVWFHQHFNTGREPPKYLALRWGSRKYPLFKTVGKRGKVDINVKQGGSQIEYEDEDPSILQLFKEEFAKTGAVCRMPTVKSRWKAGMDWSTGDER